MNISPRAFLDRRDAGRHLASKLTKYKGRDNLVLALPRGGVPVAYEVARELRAPLDVFIARKIGAPFQPELGIGAVAPGNVLVLDNETIRAFNISKQDVQRIAEEATAEMERRLRLYRGDRPLPSMAGRTVFLVDDGLATGVTAMAAVAALREMGPAWLVLAIPVCADRTADVISSRVDDLVCVEIPSNLGAVGLWYRNFDQTSDEEVLQLLDSAREQWGDSTTSQEQQPDQHSAATSPGSDSAF